MSRHLLRLAIMFGLILSISAACSNGGNGSLPTAACLQTWTSLNSPTASGGTGAQDPLLQTLNNCQSPADWWAGMGQVGVRRGSSMGRALANVCSGAYVNTQVCSHR